jgi:hypothetical protein
MVADQNGDLLFGFKKLDKQRELGLQKLPAA